MRLFYENNKQLLNPNYNPLTVFLKSFILDDWLRSEYGSGSEYAIVFFSGYESNFYLIIHFLGLW